MKTIVLVFDFPSKNRWEGKKKEMEKNMSTWDVLFRPIDTKLIRWRSENENICWEYKWKLVVAHCSSVYYIDFSIVDIARAGDIFSPLKLSEPYVERKKKRVVSEKKRQYICVIQNIEQKPRENVRIFFFCNILLSSSSLFFALRDVFSSSLFCRDIFNAFHLENYFLARLVAWIFLYRLFFHSWLSWKALYTHRNPFTRLLVKMTNVVCIFNVKTKVKCMYKNWTEEK